MKFAIALFLMGGSLFAGEWKPPENPDPIKIFQEAYSDIREKRYEEALAKYVWFHVHGPEYQEKLSGVRLTSGVRNWLRLGEHYPPALAKFKEIRDKTNQRIRHEKGARATSEDFLDLTCMNHAINQDASTVETFQYLHDNNTEAAKKAYDVMGPTLVRARKYKLCGSYLDPEKQWARIVDTHRQRREYAQKQSGDRSLNNANKSFIYKTASLIALLVINNRPEDADKIAEDARKQPVDDRYREQFDRDLKQALAGVHPKPGP